MAKSSSIDRIWFYFHENFRCAAMQSSAVTTIEIWFTWDNLGVICYYECGQRLYCLKQSFGGLYFGGKKLFHSIYKQRAGVLLNKWRIVLYIICMHFQFPHFIIWREIVKHLQVASLYWNCVERCNELCAKVSSWFPLEHFLVFTNSSYQKQFFVVEQLGMIGGCGLIAGEEVWPAQWFA